MEDREGHRFDSDILHSTKQLHSKVWLLFLYPKKVGWNVPMEDREGHRLDSDILHKKAVTF